MVEELKYSNNRTKIRYRALSMRAIRQMTAARLAEHIDYINRQLVLWNQDTTGKPAWFRDAARQWRNALNSEKRRIEGELKARAEVGETFEDSPLPTSPVASAATGEEYMEAE